MTDLIKAADALESLGLTAEHINFLSEVIFYDGCKLKDEAYGLDSDGDKSLPLWKALEDAGLIRSVGSYRWEPVNGNIMNEALKLYITTAYRQARESADGVDWELLEQDVYDIIEEEVYGVGYSEATRRIIARIKAALNT